TGATFEQDDYPALLSQLVESQQDENGDTPQSKPMVSVKTISAPGVAGVLESESDVDNYLAALRSALVSTLNDAKRISLSWIQPSLNPLLLHRVQNLSAKWPRESQLFLPRAHRSVLSNREQCRSWNARFPREAAATRARRTWPTRSPTPGSTASLLCASWMPMGTPESVSFHPRQTRSASPRFSLPLSAVRSMLTWSRVQTRPPLGGSSTVPASPDPVSMLKPRPIH